MDREELIDNITSDILTYVMEGGFPNDFIPKMLKPDNIPDRFEEFEKLMDLHFILKPEIKDFLIRFESELRNLSTDTKKTTKTYRGRVEGKINWPKTIKKRYSSNPKDNSLFECDNRNENYDTDENIVLKALLSIINNTYQDLKGDLLDNDYNWIRDKFGKDFSVINDLAKIMKRNVHIRRIKELDKYEPTDRMIYNALNSRKRIYSKAGKLLLQRKRIFNGDKEELKTLINTTAITPDDNARLFELFVLFKYVNVLEELLEGDTVIKTIAKNRQEIARIKGEEKTIVIYHDSSAADRDLSFLYNFDKGSDLSRPARVQKETREIFEDYFHNTESHTGRPDVIVLEVIDSVSNTYNYLITEVKYSRERETIRHGIKETLEYLAFLNVNGDYVFSGHSEEGIFGTGNSGVLVIQDLNREKYSKDTDDYPIKILQAEDLLERKNIKEIVSELF